MLQSSMLTAWWVLPGRQWKRQTWQGAGLTPPPPVVHALAEPRTRYGNAGHRTALPQ